ncbi:hypothetical protein PC114_g21759 [Phytophthora cactorum]|nr:hypothetical protein PC114_g21759 [Phytophthora cactorum]
MEGYNHDVLQETVDQEHLLNDEQRFVYSTIINAVDNPIPGNTLFFVDGPGGTGKSTLLKHILAKVRLSGKIALAVASSGIASLLLMCNGVTRKWLHVATWLHGGFSTLV